MKNIETTSKSAASVTPTSGRSNGRSGGKRVESEEPSTESESGSEPDSVTKNAVTKLDQKSELIDRRTIHSEALQTLSEMFASEEETPENSLLGSALRLNNVVHSLIESRENAYLHSEESYPVMLPETVESVVKLSQEARACIGLALEIKKEKVKAYKTLVEARKK